MSAVQVPVRSFAVRWLALLAGLAASSWALSRDGTGSAFLLVSPFLGLALLTAVLLGPAGAPPAAGRARLETRRLTDYLPASARPAAALLTAYGLLTLAVFLAGPQSVVVTCGNGFLVPATVPDPAVVGPALVTVLLGVAVGVYGLRRLVDRPRPAGVPVEADDRARRDAAAAVVAAGVVLVSGPLAGTAVVVGSGLSAACGPLTVLAGWGLLALAGAAGLAAAAALVRLLWPRRMSA